MFILRRSNCIVTASGIFTVCNRPYSAPIESGLQSSADVSKKRDTFYIIRYLKYNQLHKIKNIYVFSFKYETPFL